MIDILCRNCDPPMGDDCCAAATVSALWRKQLPKEVRNAVAGKSMTSDLANTLKLADAVHASTKAAQAAVAAVKKEEVNLHEQKITLNSK